MKIRTKQYYADYWSAIDEDTCDGPPTPVGTGETEEEAIADLIEKLIVRAA